MPPLIIAPSLLAANHGEFAQGIQMIEKAGLDWVHLDVIAATFSTPAFSAASDKLTAPPFNADNKATATAPVCEGR
jgi:pentose-5-phosphate-3-epimerase